jgi:flagellar biosynthesis/type III secretory pathway chaperone
MSDTQPLVEELDRLLLQEIEAYQQLLTLQQEEQRLVVAQALEPFLANLQAKEQLARKLTAYEQHRQAVTNSLRPVLQLPATPLTLRQLSTRVGEPYASRFLHYRTRLRTLVNDLRRLNTENAMLLRDSLAFIEHVLVFFDRLQLDGTTYHQSGKFTPRQQGRLLSERV